VGCSYEDAPPRDPTEIAVEIARRR